MNNKLLIDTDVLIDYLRGNYQAINYLEKLTELLFISSITVAELYAGVREGAERKALDIFICAFEIVPIDQEIAILGGLYRRDYGKSHGVGLADALIAATAQSKQAILVTLNQKHFNYLTKIIVPYQKTS